MSDFNPQAILEKLFSRLRQRGFNLGVGEYLAAQEAVAGGFCPTLEDLKFALQLLWCHSCQERELYQLIFESTSISDSLPDSEKVIPKTPETKVTQPKDTTMAFTAPPEVFIRQPEVEFTVLPIRVPFIPIESELTPELEPNFPILRRNMVYSWRYLRRMVPSGAMDVLDVPATVNQTAQQGFYLAPVYRRREVNQAHLVLLIDQDGSMTPFHRFTRELAETAQYESNLGRVEAYYFHNIIVERVYQDVHLTVPIPFAQVLETCDRYTCVLIVSDAGAARGDRRLDRIQATTKFLFQIKRYTNLITWLNPMPEDRWDGTSAKIISYLAPMYPMDAEELDNAINSLRGQFVI